MNVLDSLMAMARAAQANAYAPYSHFKVGAAVRAPSGDLYGGCNVENASYPVGICAEAAAISAMVSAGATRICEIVVYADGESLTTPCGACRQRIREFADAATLIHATGPAGRIRTFTIDELLPLAFGPDNLPA